MSELYYLIIKLINLYEIVIIAWVIMGWLQMFNALPYSRPIHMIMGILYRLADPFLGFFRRILPLWAVLIYLRWWLLSLWKWSKSCYAKSCFRGKGDLFFSPC